MKRKPKSPRKKLVEACDKAARRLVLARDGARCVLCGSARVPQCGHIFSRVAHSTRWDVRNIHVQCRDCNLRHEHNPYRFIKWAQERLGMDEFDDLYKTFGQTRKFTNEDLVLMERFLTEEAIKHEASQAF